MLQRLMAVWMTMVLGCSGLACGTKARSSTDAAPGAGTDGAAGAGGALEGGTTDGNAAGGSARGQSSEGGNAGMTTAGAGGGGAAGTTGASGAGGTTGASGAGGTTGASGLGGAGGDGGSSGGGNDAGSDGGPTDAGFDGPTCTPNVACTPNLPCKTGIVSCDSGVPRCLVTGNQPNGTLCGANVFCVSGFCDNEGCGHACTPSNRCHTGIISCTTGTNICQDTGASVPDGTICGTDQACKSGACVTCSISDGGC